MVNYQKHLLSFIFFLLLNLWGKGNPSLMAKEVIRVGVVLDLKSQVGEMAESYIKMACSDFYTVNANYRTRITPIIRDSKDDVIGAACAALDLMKNNEVHAIIGPQRSSQARFVTELGEKAQVPILSFSATTPSLSPNRSPFFIRTAEDDSAQVKAIAAIIQAYGWKEVVPIYEDTHYGNDLVPYLTEAFQEVDTRVPYRSAIPPSSKDADILKELNRLNATGARIFVLHMTASLGSKLFLLAKNAGMMSEGYAWIITEGLSDLLDPMDSKVMDSIQGVLGVRPYIHMSKHLEDFNRRLTRNFTSSGKQNLFGLRAYDTFCALARAVEKAGIEHSGFLKQNDNCTVDLAKLRVFEMGPRLLKAIKSTRFPGLSGDFHLVKGQLEVSAFEVFNVIGKTERVIGYWTARSGLSRELNGTKKLKPPIWPGETTDQPKKLRIGVPLRVGFTEFIKVEWNDDPRTHDDKPKISGFSIDVFLAVVDVLPFPLPHEFVPYVNKSRQAAGYYDDLLYQIKLKKYDVVVGDITIVANRSLYVDFTLPYSESGVSMLVLMKDNEKTNIWIFLKPLHWDLWLAITAAFIFTGLVVWVLEHRVNTEFRGPPEKQLGTIFFFSFSTLVFAHREKVVNNLSKFVLIIWIFVVLILSQSYTASLTSMLTVQRLQPTVVDVAEIKRNGYFVGYHHNFIRELLIEQLKINETKLKLYGTPEEYHEALSLGSNNGGVAAIFDEIPYIKLFLTKYGSKYAMVGPIYKTGGFGFAFPLGSPLVSHISRAILNVTEDKDKIMDIQRKYFAASQTTSLDPSAQIPSYSPSLCVYSFGGLFLITGLASMSSLLIYVAKFLRLHWSASASNSTINPDSEGSFCLRVAELAKHFDQKDLCAYPFKINESMENPSISPDDMQNLSISSSFSEGAEDVAIDDDEDDGDDDDVFSGHGDTSMGVPNVS